MKFAEDGSAMELEECWTVLSYRQPIRLAITLLDLLSFETSGFTTAYAKSTFGGQGRGVQ